MRCSPEARVAQDKVRVGMSAFQDVNSLYVGIEQGFLSRHRVRHPAVELARRQ